MSPATQAVLGAPSNTYLLARLPPANSIPSLNDTGEFHKGRYPGFIQESSRLSVVHPGKCLFPLITNCFYPTVAWQGMHKPRRYIPFSPMEMGQVLLNRALPRLHKANPGVLMHSIYCCSCIVAQFRTSTCKLVPMAPTDAQTVPRSSLGELGALPAHAALPTESCPTSSPWRTYTLGE